MRRFGLTLILLTSIFLAGCATGGTVPPVSEEEAVVEIHVDISKIGQYNGIQSLAKSIDDESYARLLQPTHVAARLVYPEFFPSKIIEEKETTEIKDNGEGIITLNAQKGKAVLQVVVVHNESWASDFNVLLYGASTTIDIRGNSVTRIKLEDLDLRPFEVDWTEEWKNRMGDNNVVYITAEDVKTRDHARQTHDFVEVKISYTSPIYSSDLPGPLQARNVGEQRYYDPFDKEWIQDGYYSYERFTAGSRIRVNDERNMFVTRRNLEVDEITSWISPGIYGEDWNLPGWIYCFLESPKFEVNGQTRPTEFTVRWKE